MPETASERSNEIRNGNAEPAADIFLGTTNSSSKEGWIWGLACRGGKTEPTRREEGNEVERTGGERSWHDVDGYLVLPWKPWWFHRVNAPETKFRV
ncbi:hypothetical protein K0M31_016045 [Melipona bicolor]|uniref:Uncharacterized protein n=1 Tax=Melipona bicolor TaxID=60889 RepID=A0AA40G6E5_9HYME|nr:hypothetical protein K0M31_016045 [Melipona bicolor]